MAKINGIETEWTLIQRQLGNLPEAEESESDTDSVDEAEEAAARLQGMSVRQLEREIEGRDGTLDDDEERELEELKQRRIRELRELHQRQQQARSGNAYKTIGAADYVREVSSASEGGLWVVCHLYAEGKEECRLLDSILRELSDRHPLTRFVRIQASLASPNFPDRNCPTVLVYHNGTVKLQLTGIEAFGGMRNASWRTVEWALAAVGAVETKMTEPPRGVKGARTEVRFIGKQDRHRRRLAADDDDDSDGDYDSESDYDSDSDSDY